MISQTKQAIFLVILLLDAVVTKKISSIEMRTNNVLTKDKVNDVQAKEKGCSCPMTTTAAVVGGLGAMLAAPLAIGALGSGAVAIATGSVVAKVMSVSAAAGCSAAIMHAGQSAGEAVTRALCHCD